jgi:hypothetical protein
LVDGGGDGKGLQEITVPGQVEARSQRKRLSE